MYKKIAITYKNNLGINVLPLKGKRPMIEWDKWQCEIQTEEDVNKMDWSNSTGIGGIQGINDWRCIDIDGAEDYEIIEKILRELELPERYSWVVQSGSGEGFHIYVRCLQPTPSSPPKRGNLDFIGGEKAVYKYKIKSEGYCDHIELRWKDCQTALPPSMHESGGIYNYYFDEPKVPPAYVELDKIICCLEKYCEFQIQNSKVKSQNLQKHKQVQEWEKEKVYYDKARLEGALDFLSENLPDGSYDEWYKIGFALVPLGEQGERYFIDMSLKNPNYNDGEFELSKKFNSLVQDYDGRVSIGTIYHIAELYGWKKPIIKFWYRESNKLKISRVRFKKFLESEGFCKYRIEQTGGTGSNHLYVRIENNIVDEVSSTDVKEFVMNHVERMATEEFEGTNRNEIIETLIKSANQLFTQQFLEFIITRNIEFNKDTADKGYFYFLNGYVKVNKHSKEFLNYRKLDGNIWKKQIIKRKYIENEYKTPYEDFLFNVCRSNGERFNALKSAIGYMLHTYKDPTVRKAIIFIDEKLSEGAYGASGKGLVIKSITKLRNVAPVDGRNFSFARNFAFQRVRPDTDILAFEDVKEKFPFEKLFSIITDGITIEQKNKDEIFIPFNDSPKIVMSSNFSIKGVDDSTLDRQFIVEFSDYYNNVHRPIHEFGKYFFENWDGDEWSRYDNFMMGCLQLYLRKGLLPYEYVNLEKKKLIDETCPEFVEFAEILETGKEYEKKELYESFKKEYEDFEKLTQSKFTRWLKVWGKVKGLEVKEGKSGSKRTISFIIEKAKKEAA
jgi:hypothetical protein